MVKLIKTNLRKDKTILTIFLLIIILSTFLMSLGMMSRKYNDLYAEYVEELGVADFEAYAASYEMDALNEYDPNQFPSYEESIKEHFDETEYTEAYHDLDAVMLPTVEFTTSNDSSKKNSTNWVFQNLNDIYISSIILWADRDDSVQGKKIYLNVYTANSNSLDIGDKIYIDSSYGEYEYTLAGTYQHLHMGSAYTYYSALVEESDFTQMEKDRDEAIKDGAEIGWNHVIDVDLKEGYDAEECLRDTKDALAGDLEIPSEGFYTEDGNEFYCGIINILSGFIGAFAIIIMAICVIIIVFTINNNISRDVTNIGALKAVGFTVNQIRTALMAEYTILSFIGAVLGMGLSYLIYPLLERSLIRQLTGIIWKNHFYIADSVIIVISVLAIIIITTFFATARIRKLHPATALRFGFQSKAMSKNHMPLAKAQGELNSLLAIKSFIQNRTQNIIIAFIMFAVGFVVMFSCVLYYNAKIDISKFQRMILGDVADAFIYVNDNSKGEIQKTMDRLDEVEGVKETYGLSIYYAYVDGIETDLVYGTNPEAFSFDIYEGRIFKEKKEAVLGLSLAKEIDAKVGDKVTLSYGDKEIELTVTGLQQSALNNRIYVSDEAAEELGIDITYPYIRLNVENADIDKVNSVLKDIEALNYSNIKGTENQFQFQRSKENTPIYAVGLMVLLLVVLNVFVVLLVVRLLLKTVFVKREKEFGIKKALGFTSLQLRYQLSLSLIPSTLLAATLGAIAGFFYSNPLLAAVLSNYGLKVSRLIIHPDFMIVPATAVPVLVFIFSFIMSGRMKRISAFKNSI